MVGDDKILSIHSYRVDLVQIRAHNQKGVIQLQNYFLFLSSKASNDKKAGIIWICQLSNGWDWLSISFDIPRLSSSFFCEAIVCVCAVFFCSAAWFRDAFIWTFYSDWFHRRLNSPNDSTCSQIKFKFREKCSNFFLLKNVKNSRSYVRSFLFPSPLILSIYFYICERSTGMH